MEFPSFKSLSEADKARDWKAGITQQEYSEAKGARKEMLGHLAGRTVKQPVQRKNHDRRVQNNFNIITKKAKAGLLH